MKFERFRKITQDILRDNKDLLKRMAESMHGSGGMSSESMLKMIQTNLGTLDNARLETAKRENDYGWYLSKL